MDDNNIKNKNELILQAKQILVEKYPEIRLNLNDFNIRVWSNDFDITKVIFNRVIRYVSNETEDINYDITVNINTEEIIPFDNEYIEFYTPSKKADMTINHLKKQGILPKNIKPDIEYTISENLEYYLISCFDNLYNIDKNLLGNEEHPYLSKTLVNKKTGETLFFKGHNPYYYLNIVSFKDYYQENLYTVLNGEDSSKKRIKEIAASILKEKQPNFELNPDDFEIVILGNYKDIIVKYRRYIRFEKYNQKKIFDIAVNITTKEVRPFNSSKDSLYKPTSSDQNAIEIIQGHIDLERSSNVEHNISENEDHYWISTLSEGQVKKNLIDKMNNKVIWTNQSYNLPINYREDLSLQEHYKRMNRFFDIKTENKKTLIDIAITILEDDHFITENFIDDYLIDAKASKSEVDISFTRLVKFVPLRFKDKAHPVYNFNISLISKKIHQNPAIIYIPTKKESITIKMITNKLIKYIKDFKPSYYPIEIIEEKGYYSINTSETFNFEEIRNYRFNKKTKKITTIVSPLDFYPTPAIEPSSFDEIK